MHGTALMPADEQRLFTQLGEVKNEIKSLRADFTALKDQSTNEHRKVHDIVVAMSESVRNMARDVADMKPHVEDYRLKSEKIDEAVDLAEEHEEERIERRGADKFIHWLYGIWAGFGALIIFLLGKLWDLLPFSSARHP